MTESTSTEQLLASGPGLLPRVNLLPPELAERRVFRRVQLGLGASVIVVIVIMALFVVAAGHSVTSAKKDLADAQAQHATLVAQQASYANVSAIYAAADAAKAQLVAAMGDEIRFSQLLADLSLSIPSSVWLSNLSYTTSSFSVSATGFTHNDVGLWLESIAALKTYSNPYFASSSEGLLGTKKIVTFSATATLTPAAMSGRYTQPAGG